MGRMNEEIASARSDWMSSSRSGEAEGYDGGPPAAPELPATPLKPRGRVC